MFLMLAVTASAGQDAKLNTFWKTRGEAATRA
jgi:hypothetical protein